MPDTMPLTLFCLHFLGGSAREWRWLALALGSGVRLMPLDLPGFGDGAASGGQDVAAMAEQVAQAVRAAAPAGGAPWHWGLAGHSMGAKVALALARRAEDGEPGLAGLSRLVLLGGSPPAPEPLEDQVRAEMLAWFAGPPDQSHAEATGYIARNVGATLPEETHAQALADVLRAHPGAWRDWLEHGSREDWVERIGVLQTPALIVAGSADAGLGPQAQRRLMAPHLARHRLVTLDGAGHLLPMERPNELARLILAHAGEDWAGEDWVGREHDAAGKEMSMGEDRTAADPSWSASGAPAIAPGYAALLESPRIATPLRTALRDRAQPDDPNYAPRALDASALATLRAVTARVLPQPEGAAIDLGARLDAMLAEGAGDGWRFASLPPDVEATGCGLATLDAAAGGHGAFATLDAAAQDALLRACGDGTLSPAGARLDAGQMRDWFEDVRAAAVKIYVGHPATLARIGYDGVFAGGDDVRTAPGFPHPTTGEPESRQPRATADLS